MSRGCGKRLIRASFRGRGGKVLRMVVVGLLLFVPVRILATIHRELQQDLFGQGIRGGSGCGPTVAKPGETGYSISIGMILALVAPRFGVPLCRRLDPSFLHLTDPDFFAEIYDFGRSDVPETGGALFLMETSKSRILCSKRENGRI